VSTQRPVSFRHSRKSFDRQDDVRRPIVFGWTPEPRDRFVLGAYVVNRQIQGADLTAPGPFLRCDNCVLGQHAWNTVCDHLSHASVSAFRNRCSQPLNHDIWLSAWSLFSLATFIWWLSALRRSPARSLKHTCPTLGSVRERAWTSEGRVHIHIHGAPWGVSANRGRSASLGFT